MNPQLRKALIAIGIITIITIAIILIPRGLSVYFQVKGGQQIEYVLRFEEGFDELACEQLQSSNVDDFEVVEGAKTNFNRAISLNNRNSQAYYYLAKGYCLVGDLESARDNYLRYTQLRPENPLGHLGLGLAYEKLCLDNQTALRSNNEGYKQRMNECSDLDMRELIEIELQKAGTSRRHLSEAGSKAFNNQDYEASAHWFALANLFKPKLEFGDRFLWMVSENLNDKQNQIRNQIPVYIIDRSIMIEAENMHLIEPDSLIGKTLSDIPSNNPSVGVLWTNGTVIAVIETADQGEYEIVLKVMESPPSPINFQIEIDFMPIEQFSLTRADLSWREVEIITTLNKGRHLIGVSFLNDSLLGELDRNLLLDWIRISGPQS